MRRKPGALVPFELAICQAAAGLRRKDREFHGYEIAKLIADDRDAQVLTGYGTLYRALDRLEKMGLLRSRWEDAKVRGLEGRPIRRLYTLTAEGEAALKEAEKEAASRAPSRARRRLAPA